MPVRINMLQGRMQRLFYRKDQMFSFHQLACSCGCVCFFRFVQSGYMGHLTDSTVLTIVFFQQFQMEHIMADLGFKLCQVLRKI